MKADVRFYLMIDSEATTSDDGRYLVIARRCGRRSHPAAALSHRRFVLRVGIGALRIRPSHDATQNVQP
ncbi:MAG: hypothetical protein ACLP1X_05015 [Polyangiaceae bacterium]